MPIFEPDLTEKEINDVLKDLIIEKPIGGGGQAPVFLIQLQDGRKGALKIYNLSKIIAKRVENEIDALRKLNSKIVVKLIAYGDIILRNEKCIYTIYDYIEGSDLEKLIDLHGALDEDIVVRIDCF